MLLSISRKIINQEAEALYTLSKSLDKNFALYPGLLDPNVEVWPVPDRYDNHNSYVINLKSWIQKRMSWLETSL